VKNEFNAQGAFSMMMKKKKKQFFLPLIEALTYAHTKTQTFSVIIKPETPLCT